MSPFVSGSPCDSTDAYGDRLPQFCIMLKSDPCLILGWIRGEMPVYIGAAGAVASRAALAGQRPDQLFSGSDVL